MEVGNPRSNHNISLATTQKGDKKFNKISVSDYGIGFAAEIKDVIFNTFTRLNSVDNYEGTGLGLALGKNIVERHPGTISANSNENQGHHLLYFFPLTSYER
jgi:signal transduction histidine kinase